MKYHFTALSQLEIIETNGHQKIDGVGITLFTSDNLNADMYQQNGIPTQEGTKVITEVFVQGLIANIHAAHQKKYIDSAEHLRHIVDELEKGFVRVADVIESTLKKPNQ